jgi:hypothetical protein
MSKLTISVIPDSELPQDEGPPIQVIPSLESIRNRLAPFTFREFIRNKLSVRMTFFEKLVTGLLVESFYPTKRNLTVDLETTGVDFEAVLQDHARRNIGQAAWDAFMQSAKENVYRRMRYGQH